MLDPTRWRRADGRSIAFFPIEAPVSVAAADIDALVAIAAAAGQNARLCLHQSPEADLHEMVIAQSADRWFPPKRHPLRPKSYMGMRGRLAVCTFDESGALDQGYVLDPATALQDRMLRLDAGIFHVNFPLEPWTVHFETRLAPIDDIELAPWGPGEDAAARRSFRARCLGEMGITPEMPGRRGG